MSKTQITIKQLQQDLKDGVDRKGIAKKYGVTQAEVKEWFKHPKLKNLKVHRAVESSFELVDDADDYGAAGAGTTEEVVGNATVATAIAAPAEAVATSTTEEAKPAEAAVASTDGQPAVTKGAW